MSFSFLTLLRIEQAHLEAELGTKLGVILCEEMKLFTWPLVEQWVRWNGQVSGYKNGES